MNQPAEELLKYTFTAVGQITTASNVALLMQASESEAPLKAIFKPTSGTKYLWDFPKNDLVQREYLTYLLSEKSNLKLVPTTVVREIAPYGYGMLQVWIDDAQVELVKLFDADQLDPGFTSVLSANDQNGHSVSLGVKDTTWIENLTIFDAVINNSDRKGSHIITDQTGENWAIDHGVCWHHDYKLRTVNWHKAGTPLTDNARATLEIIEKALIDLKPIFEKELSPLEFVAAYSRIEQLKANDEFPLPATDWPAIPWPVF